MKEKKQIKNKCPLCLNHSDDDIGYVNCPMAKGLLCIPCCYEIDLEMDETIGKAKAIFGVSKADIIRTCSNCEHGTHSKKCMLYPCIKSKKTKIL